MRRLSSRPRLDAWLPTAAALLAASTAAASGCGGGESLGTSSTTTTGGLGGGTATASGSSTGNASSSSAGTGGTTASTSGTGGSGTGGASTSSTTATGTGGSSTTGTGGASSSSSGGTSCASPASCPGADTECATPTCSAGQCGFLDAPAGVSTTQQVPGDCMRVVCDGMGGLTTTADSSDVPVDGNPCTADICTGGVPSNPPFVGGACGPNNSMHCDDAGACVQCLATADCTTGVCSQHVCVAAACADGMKNGTETDVDCGGAGCPKCADTKACLASSDCATGFCNAGVCKAPTCSDGVKNGTETGVDCGGPSCAVCPTVLLLGSSTAGTLAGELHPGGSWITSTLADTSMFGPSLTITGAGQGIGVITSQTNGEVHWTQWNGGVWTPFQPAAATALAREQPFVDANGGATAHLLYQDGTYHFLYLGYSSAAGWTAVPEPVGGGAGQSYGPVPAAVAALGADATTAFIDGAGPNVNYAAARDRVGGAWQAATDLAASGNFDVSPSIIALGAGPELMELYVRSDTQILFMTRTAGVWSAATPITNCLTADRVALAPLPGGGAILAFRGTDTNLYWSVFSGTAWSAVAPLATPNVSLVGSPAVTHGIAGDTAEIAFVEGDGKAYHARLSAGAWTAPVAVGGAGLVGVAITSAP